MAKAKTVIVGVALAYLLFMALGASAALGILWVLAVGRAATWSLIVVFSPLLLWCATFASGLLLACVADICALVARSMRQRKALRDALEADA